MSYTALGDGVNIAARLEGINKVYGTSICVSGAIHDAVSQRFVMRPLDHVAVKGRSVPILIYELMGTLTDELEIGASEEQREKARMTDAAFQAWIERFSESTGAIPVVTRSFSIGRSRAPVPQPLQSSSVRRGMTGHFPRKLMCSTGFP
jgi:hypothetical protein